MDALTYIEVSLTTLGWQISANIVSLVYSLNLHYMPFAVIVLRNWFETNKSQDSGYAAVTALKRNEVDVYSAILICVLFWIPNSVTSINPSEATYYKFDEKSEDLAATATEGAKSLGFDVENDSDIPIPPAWWAFLKFSKGITYQLISRTDINTDYSNLLSSFSSIKIKDQVLKSEVNDFYTTCYRPTLDKHLASPSLPVGAESADTTWIGSSLFVDIPGYYGDCTSALQSKNQCVLKFAYLMPSKVLDRYGLALGFKPDGTQIRAPTCKDWWLGVNPETGAVKQEYGLKQRLIKEVGWKAALEAAYEQEEALWDPQTINASIKRLLRNDQPTMSYVPGWNRPKDVKAWYQVATGFAQDIGGAVGLGIDAGFASIFAETIRPALPMVQALFMMVLIIASPLLLLFSAFSPVFAFSLVYSMFMVISLSFIWHIADLLDNKLMKQMYPNAKILTELSLTGTNTDLAWVIVSSFSYIGLALLWLALLGKVGVGLANSMGSGISDAKSAGGDSVKRLG